MPDGKILERSSGLGERFQTIQLLDQAGALNEGAWVDVRVFQGGTIEMYGPFVATARLMAANSLIPPNIKTVLVSGTPTVGEEVSLTIINSQLTDGFQTVSYTVLAGDTNPAIASALKLLLISNTELAALGFVFSTPAPLFPGYDSVINMLVPFGEGSFTFEVISSLNTTLGLGIGTDGRQLISDITAAGFYSYAADIRWLKLMVTSYTSGAVTAILHQSE